MRSRGDAQRHGLRSHTERGNEQQTTHISVTLHLLCALHAMCNRRRSLCIPLPAAAKNQLFDANKLTVTTMKFLSLDISHFFA
ncbi:hypothetical protein CCU68_31505 [Pseudomonas gingeri NCPPB 3146 = LMG 5327]|uniref:Uncharacterized protein n=1 Tax=Pseudomonas gingeri NCPPB 3146 = LMG 5327 TaxID=707248 RepID=A0ABX4XUN4_9PSED|nr:hypothetical protein CCU68_31505 [Pseudomonas gingeri NCPPB 3146 = LMG 5327]